MSHAKREVGAACAWRLFFHAEAVTIAFFVQSRALHLQSRLASAILLITDVLHPIDNFSIERFLDCNVCHRCRGRRAVPMLFALGKPDHIARVNRFNYSAPMLRPPKAGRNDQRLTEWMCMPGGAGTRLERDACATNISGLTRDRPITRRFPSGFTVYPSASRHDVFPRLEQRINSYRASEPVRRAFGRLS
jgi:hypothetical protein